MLQEAITEIERLRAAEQARLRRQDEQRRQLRCLDRWLNRIEAMLEKDQTVVPEPLLDRIGALLLEIDPRLQGQLLELGGDAARVLDLLFEAQEQVLPKASRRPGESSGRPG